MFAKGVNGDVSENTGDHIQDYRHGRPSFYIIPLGQEDGSGAGFSAFFLLLGWDCGFWLLG